jgi:hypothetical protein
MDGIAEISIIGLKEGDLSLQFRDSQACRK